MLASPALRGDRWGAGGADDASCETSSKGDGSPAPMLADETAKEKPAAPVLKSALGERRGDTDPARRASVHQPRVRQTKPTARLTGRQEVRVQPGVLSHTTFDLQSKGLHFSR